MAAGSWPHAGELQVSDAGRSTQHKAHRVHQSSGGREGRRWIGWCRCGRIPSVSVQCHLNPFMVLKRNPEVPCAMKAPSIA